MEDQSKTTEQPTNQTEILSEDVARQEIEDWMDEKRIRESKREDNKESVDVLVDALKRGLLERDQDGNLVQNLLFPIQKEQGQLTQLHFKKRMTRKQVKPFLKKVEPKDIDGRIVAYAAALSGQSSAIIESLDSEDQGITDAVAVFFVA